MGAAFRIAKSSSLAWQKGEFQVKFGADVVKVDDQILGTLIDIKA